MKKLSTFFATLLVSVLLIGSTSFAQTTTWTGATGETNWSLTGNWNNGVPNSAVQAVIDLAPAIQPVLDVDATCGGLTFTGTSSNTVGLSLNGKTLTVVGSVDLSGGRLVGGSGSTIKLTGSWTLGTGTFLTGTSTVQFNGSTARTINAGNIFYNLDIANTAGTVALVATSIVTVNNVLSLSLATSSLNDNGQTIVVNGGLADPFTRASGATFTSSGTFSYKNTSSTNVLGGTYKNLEISGAGGTFTSTGALSVNGTLIIGTSATYNAGSFTHSVAGNFTNNGTFNAQTSTYASLGGSLPGVTYNNLNILENAAFTGSATVSGTLTIASGKTLEDDTNEINSIGTLANSGTLKLEAITATPMPTVTTFNQTGTVQFAGASNQTVNPSSGGNYFNLSFAGATAKTASGDLTVTGDFNISAGTFADNGKTISIGGTWTRAGTYTATGTINFTGTGGGTTLPAETFKNLTLSPSGTLTATGAITVTGTFNLASGTFASGGFTTWVAGTWTQAGTYTGTGTVNFNGASAQTLGAATINNLAVSGTGTVTSTGNLTLNGTFALTNGTYVAGNFNHTFKDDFSNDGGTFTATTGNSITFAGSSLLTITATNPVSFYNVVISSGSVALAGTNNVTVTSSMAVNGGTLITGGKSITGAGSFTLGSGATLSMANTSGITNSGDSPILVTGTPTYDAGANYILSGGTQITGSGFPSTVNNLTFNSSAIVTVTNPIAITGSLTIANTVSFTPTFAGTLTGYTSSTGGLIYGGSADITVGNEWPSAGITNVTLNTSPNAQNVNLDGDRSISGTLTLTKGVLVVGNNRLSLNQTDGSGGSVTFGSTGSMSVTQSAGVFMMPTNLSTLSNLQVNNTNGVQLQSNIAVTGTLTMDAGVITTGTNTLTLGSGTGIGTLTYNGGTIVGNYRVFFANTTSSTVNFPVGTASNTRLATVTFTGSPSATGSLTAKFVTLDPGNSGLPLVDNGVTINKASQDGYWQLSSGDGLTGGIYTMTLNGAGFGGVTDVTKLILLKRVDENANWILNGTAVTGSGSNSAPVVTRTGMVGFSQFGIGSDQATNPLAVELVSFTGSSKENTVSLSWTTATEHDNYGFNIERTVTGMSEWAEVGFVKGSGTSNSPKTYSFVDNITGAGSFDYRMKQTDINGLSRYIGSVVTVTANVPTEFALSQNYPNPFNPSTIIKYAIPQASFVTLRIYNMLGQEVATLVNGQTDIGFHSITWNGRTNSGSFASSGVYIYRIVAGDFVQVKKMNFLK